ncbi:MAG: hypothetical protein FWC99_04090 [Coriobacteriia bacterium]|nr:hypothetical protein [Coriobacteriia bacterium]
MNALLHNKALSKLAKVLVVVALALIAISAALGVAPAKALAATNTVTIPVEQIFALSPGAVHTGTFDYEITRLDPSYPLPVGAEGNSYRFTITGNTTESAGPFTFDRVGLFTYEVGSVHAPGEGLTLDDSVFTVVIAVRNAPGGGFIAELRAIFEGSNTLPGNKIEDIVFEKALASPLESDPVANPPVVKTVQGNPATAYTFTFRLEAASSDYPMPEGATGVTKDITIAGSGRAYFGQWTHSMPGVFTYTVREIATDNEDYVFDTTVYTITDTVRNEDGQLVVDRVVTNDDNRQVTSMTFINFFVGDDVEVQQVVPGTPGITAPGGGGSSGTASSQPVPGPKTGDYADPLAMVLGMAISALVVFFTLVLILMDRRSEREHGQTAVSVAT